MANDLVKASTVSVPTVSKAASLPELVERAGGAARFAWDEFFYAEHHNPHTQKAYMRAVKRFLVRGTIDSMEPTATRTPESHDEPSTFPVVTEYIGVRPGYCGGEPHILGHRIKVRHVAVWHEREGMTPTEIAATYPSITLAQVHAALAYHYDHRDEIHADIEAERRFVEELKARTPPSKLQELLEARKADHSDLLDGKTPSS